jgi:hypothetical protein
MMEINSAAPSSSTWKLNNLKVISKPPILVEVDPVKHEMGSDGHHWGVDGDHWSGIKMVGKLSVPMVGEAMSTTAGEVMPMMVGDATLMSMSMVGDAVSMVGDAMSMVGDAESMAIAGGEPSTLVGADELVEVVDAGRSMVVGEGAGESVDLDPVVPTVGTN